METLKFKNLEEAALIWETEKKIGNDPSGNPVQEITDEVKKRFGDFESFMTEFNPTKQALLSDFQEVAEGDYPTVKSVCLTYGKDSIHGWICAQLMDLTRFANCNSLTKGQTQELSTIIVNECQHLTVAEILHFFYYFKSGKFVYTDGNLSPMVIMLYMRQFISKCNARLWFEEKEKEQIKKCYLIIENQPNQKVYARVFRTKENAEKALEERDYRTGERLYPACHIIERTIE